MISGQRIPNESSRLKILRTNADKFSHIDQLFLARYERMGRGKGKFLTHLEEELLRKAQN